jgi:hypothetical protein
MKVYLVKCKKSNVRWFDNDKDLIDFLISSTESRDSYQIITVNAKPESEMSGEIFLESFKNQNRLDVAISAVTGDEFASKVQTLIELYEYLCKKAPWDKNKMSQTANNVYEKLITTAPVEKDFKKIGPSVMRYLTYCVSDSVEWYKALLMVYPNIKKLNETCDSEYIDPVTYGTRFSGHRTTDKMIKNFEKAKRELS